MPVKSTIPSITTAISITTAMLLASGLLVPVAASEATTAPDPDSEPVSPAVRYEDAVGDVPAGVVPDIVAVTVSQPDAALVSFSIEFASDPPLSYDLETMSTDELHVLMAAEPVVESADYWHAIVHGATLPQAVETGASMYDTGADVMLPNVVGVAVDGTTVTLTVERSLLGDPDQLAFAVAVTSEAVDEAAVEGADEAAEAPAAEAEAPAAEAEAPAAEAADGAAEQPFDVCPDEEEYGVYTFTSEEP